jgi:hypothetical protein
VQSLLIVVLFGLNSSAAGGRMLQLISISKQGFAIPTSPAQDK